MMRSGHDRHPHFTHDPHQPKIYDKSLLGSFIYISKPLYNVPLAFKDWNEKALTPKIISFPNMNIKYEVNFLM